MPSAKTGSDIYRPVALPTKPIAISLSAARMWQNKWFLLGSVSLFSLVGLMLGAVHTPLYRVQASLEVHAPAQSSDTNSRQQGSPDLVSPYMQTEVRITRSRSVAERAMSKLADSERNRLLEPRYFWWGKSTYDQNVDAIRGRLQVHASGQANILDLAFLTPDAAAGAHFLNAVAQELSDYMVESNWRLAQHRREWSDRQLDDLRRRWEESERLLAEYSQTTSAAPPSKAVPAPRLASEEASDSSLIQLKRRQVELSRELNQWTSLYGPSTPTANRLRSEAVGLAAAIRTRRAALAKVAPASDASPAGITPVHDFTKHETIAHLTVLRQEVDSSRRAYQSAESQLQAARIAPATQVGDINVVDSATPDGAPVTPNQFLNGSLGALTGLLIGVGCVALRDRYSRTFSNPDLLHDYLGIEVLGSIPAESTIAADVAADANEPVLNLAYGHDASTAEAYRSIRSAIFFKMENASGPMRFVLTSASETEGRTTVTGNLGAALASAQRRVLLVDGDLRNPGLHKVFGAGNDYGLADLLGRQLSATTVSIRDVIRATQVPGLYLLSAGQAGSLAPEILSSVQLPQLLLELGKGFDFILIDSPPVLPYSDTRILARAADAAVLIVRAAVTSRRSALIARDVVSHDGIKILGSILTDWDNSQTFNA